ncbi:MAG: hypothetical protein LC664_15330 [Flavobacteriales bacterium]|nr:hypothetical protein [Flavobacteriales bacterium]
MANTDSQSAILNDVFELIQKWMEDSGNSELPVNTYLKPEELEAETQFKLPSRQARGNYRTSEAGHFGF